MFSELPARKWGPRSIAVYCGPGCETWTPASQYDGGIGGSETAIIELTTRLARMGWEITVYNQCGAPPEGLEFDGVRYCDYHSFHRADQFDVLWVWRHPEMFDYDFDARLRILDLHDAMSAYDYTPERVAHIDKIFMKSRFHRSLWKLEGTRWTRGFPEVPEGKFVIVGNGIDLARFQGNPARDPRRFIYASCPGRGLEVVLKLWPRIRQELPEATLHVFYGWKSFVVLEKDDPKRLAWMRSMQAMMEQPGVVDHGRVGQKQLAEEELQSSFWLYPTRFPEIDCITAKEMQAAGVLPITSGYAALEQSQQSGCRLPGNANDPGWQEQYLELVLRTASSGTYDPQEPMAAARQFDWSLVADRWNRELQ